MSGAILPPATIGILGGGQLGRMTGLAARSMGYGVQVMDPSAACAAGAVADRVVVGGYDDVRAAAELARQCDVVTIEIEQISPEALHAAAAHAPLRPGPDVLRMVQDRARQKDWLAAQRVPIGRYAIVDSLESLTDAARTLGPDLFVKACRGGFDGRGQFRLGTDAGVADVITGLRGERAVAEQGLDLVLELSVLVARRPGGGGAMMTYPVAVNVHEKQVLAWSVMPGPLEPQVEEEARRIALHIADALSLEGILAVEMFLLSDGRLLVNELAPRPHNSYHASELACPTSQFEQLVRAACDLPLGDATPARPAAIVNLFGDLWLDGRAPDFARALEVPTSRLFLYGKGAPRAGRKMGHIAALGATAAEALNRVKLAAAAL